MCASRLAPYYFLHIPKTAGTSFRVALENQFNINDICHAYTFHELKSFSDSQLSKFRLFRGHMGYNLANYIPNKPHILCVLRNPLERSVSHFDYIRKDPGHPKYTIIREKNLTLTDYLKDPELSSELRNAQTRPLCHQANRATLQHLLNQSRSQAEFAYLWRHTPGVIPPPDELLDIAKSRLGSMFFVGIAERLNDSIDLIAYLFHARKPATQALNVNPSRTRLSELDQGTIDLLKETTALDVQIYEYAYNLFERQRQSMARDMLEHNYRLLYPENHIRRKKITVDFNEPLPGTGWHQRELLPGTGIVRWTGPDTISDLDIPLANGFDYRVTIKVVDSVDEKALTGILLAVNNQHLKEHEVRQVADNHIEINALINKKLLAENLPYTRLSIQLPFTRVPHESESGVINHNYARKIGLAIQYVAFEAV